jgi:hypothetical protein
LPELGNGVGFRPPGSRESAHREFLFLPHIEENGRRPRGIVHPAGQLGGAQGGDVGELGTHGSGQIGE